MNPENDDEQWRNRIARAIAELRSGEERIRGAVAHHDDTTGPASESYPPTTRSPR